MIYGYARASVTDPDNALQLKAFEGFGCNKVFEDKLQKTDKKNSELAGLLAVLREGDTVIVDRFSTLNNRFAKFIQLMDFFNKNGITFISIENGFNSSSERDHGSLIFCSDIVAMESELLKEKARKSLAGTRRYSGGRRPVDTDKIRMALDSYYKGIKMSKIVEVTGVSKVTIYKYMKIFEKEAQKP